MLRGLSGIVFASVASAVVITGAALGCSSTVPPVEEEEYEDDDSGETEGDASTSDAPIGTDIPVQFYPTRTYSGVDGTHTFQIPIAVYGSKTATIKASDPSAFEIAPASKTVVSVEESTYFLVTAKKEGEFTLTASEPSSSKPSTATATLTVTRYDAARYAVGERRYKNDAASGPACSSCHGPGKVDHSPSAISSVRDDQVVTVITAGILKDGNPITKVDHRWAVTDSEADGLVTYLRALVPNGYTKR